MYKILVVDDHEQNVVYLNAILKKEGYTIISSFDGKSGMEKAINEQPDLILLDIMLPEITGLEICEILTKNPATSEIPIILVTARVSAEDTKIGLQSGAVDYIKKPFDKVEILARIKTALRVRDAKRIIVETEKLNIFAATVLTANHKIKQPLTVMKLAISGIRRELEKQDYEKNSLLKRLDYLETSVNEITTVLNQLKAVQNPYLSEYLRNIQMVDIEKSIEHNIELPPLTSDENSSENLSSEE